MASSGYTPGQFYAGQQPTVNFWNLLFSNDSSFNSGLGFNDSIIINRHIASQAVSASQLIGLALFGAGSSHAGSPPATPNGQFYMQSGTIVAATNSAGGGSVTFPNAFPNGCLTVLVCEGNNTVTNEPTNLISVQVTATSFGFQNVGAISTNIQVDYIAIGF